MAKPKIDLGCGVLYEITEEIPGQQDESLGVGDDLVIVERRGDMWVYMGLSGLLYECHDELLGRCVKEKRSFHLPMF